jgi:complement component 1 Q subcomponent-binding protein
MRARTAAWACASRRGFASDAVKPERTLTEALLEEHAHESAAYEPSETATAGPPAPFELHETKGDAEMTLTRKFGENDAEEVTVTFIAQEDPYEEDDFDDEDFDIEDDAEAASEEDDLDGLDDDEDAIAISFNVVVSKADGSAYLDFDCLTDGEIIEIRHVGFEAFDEENPMIGTTYTGPNFEDLEESVQDKFHDYLEERGINADLANYIIEAHLDKEQREYTSWLERVAHFVKK